jgi:hypothetical protein
MAITAAIIGAVVAAASAAFSAYMQSQAEKRANKQQQAIFDSEAAHSRARGDAAARAAKMQSDRMRRAARSKAGVAGVSPFAGSPDIASQEASQLAQYNEEMARYGDDSNASRQSYLAKLYGHRASGSSPGQDAVLAGGMAAGKSLAGSYGRVSFRSSPPESPESPGSAPGLGLA